MKAIVITQFGGPEVLAWQEVPDPTPGPGQVLIRTEAASVNFADLKMRTGTYSGTGKPPLVPGLDVAGRIVTVGPGVTGFREGQLVAGFCNVGGYAELAVAPALLTWAVPEEIDLDQAAAFPTVGVTAYNLLTMAGRLTRGETVLIHAAAGGVGSTAVQLAKLLGAGMVIGTVGDDAKADLARSLGCDHVINYRREPFAPRVNALTGGAGADLILDAVAGEVFDQSLTCLAPFGRLVNYGFSSGGPGTVRSDQLNANNRSVIGYSSGHYRRQRPAAMVPAGDAVLKSMREGHLRFVIGGRFPMSEAAEAHRLIERRQNIGKILLIP